MKSAAQTTLLIAFCCCALLPAAFAATSQDVYYKSGDETVHSLLFTPPGKGPFPGIVVIQEYWGLNDWVKEQASKLADQGYAALAVDLYRGKVADTPDVAHELMRGLPEDRAARDLHAAVEYLKSSPNVKKDRIAAIGWCMGGGLALNLALSEPTLTAVVINYGHLSTDPAAIQKIHAAILGNFGGQDRGIPPEDVKKFEETLKKEGKQADIKIYPDAGHAFQNPNNKSGYRAEDTADAWQRTVNFLATTLKK